MNKEDLKKRTKAFALEVMDLTDHLPQSPKGRVFTHQMIRCGTSVGANYRAACRARSTAEFVAKVGTVIEEADETAYWIELALDGGLLDALDADSVWREADELVAIMTASRKTAERSLLRDSEIGNRKSAIKSRP
jgi:four helix bundle protein